MSPRRTGVATGLVLLVVYGLTLAPDVTFWDAGEFIAAAYGFGIPHPPGTPLYVALGHVVTRVLGPTLGVARASNFLSAVCTAVAGAMSACTIASGVRGRRGVQWGAVAAGLCAGLGTSVWANATETEVYAFALLYVVLMFAAAERASRGVDRESERWGLCTAYLIALCPAIHLSALVGAPAVILLASRSANGRWQLQRLILLTGAMFVAAGVGLVFWPLLGLGVIAMAASVRLPHGNARRLAALLQTLLVVSIAASALAILLVRATHDPALNQGDPSTIGRLLEVVSRKQYDVAPMWPRRAPVWIQLGALAQYADWQFGMGLGNGVFTSPARVAVATVYALLGVAGWRALRRDANRIAESLLLLGVCGTLGVCAYLNLKAGASIGYGFVPVDAHEARERDYFFVLGFWTWGLCAGYGAFSMATARGLPVWTALGACIAPLAANWASNDRSGGQEAHAPRIVAEAMLSSVPRGGVLFVAGDNDTYPLWYLQQVELFRTDVTVITIPLLSADWYYTQLVRRMELTWRMRDVPGARYAHEQRAALLSAGARAAGRPIAAGTQPPARERALIGSAWHAVGAVYLSDSVADGSNRPPRFDSSAGATRSFANQPLVHRSRLPDDVTSFMLGSLRCGRLGTPASAGNSADRDSLEVRCNVR